MRITKAQARRGAQTLDKRYRREAAAYVEPELTLESPCGICGEPFIDHGLAVQINTRRPFFACNENLLP